MKIIFLDTETTDTDETARLVQLAYKVHGKEPVEHFFKPPCDISFGAMATHHITNEMVADKPAFEGSEAKEELQKLLDENILVAHNAPFDIRILEAEGLKVKWYIDTLKVVRHLLPDEERHSLQFLRYSLDLYKELGSENSAHNALDDIAVLELLFETIQKFAIFNIPPEKDSEKEPERALLAHLVNLSQKPVLLKKFNFGKHKDKTFEEVAKTAKNYLVWLRNAEAQKPKEEQNEDLMFTLSKYL